MKTRYAHKVLGQDKIYLYERCSSRVIHRWFLAQVIHFSLYSFCSFCTPTPSPTSKMITVHIRCEKNDDRFFNKIHTIWLLFKLKQLFWGEKKTYKLKQEEQTLCQLTFKTVLSYLHYHGHECHVYICNNHTKF